MGSCFGGLRSPHPLINQTPGDSSISSPKDTSYVGGHTEVLPGAGVFGVWIKTFCSVHNGL